MRLLPAWLPSAGSIPGLSFAPFCSPPVLVTLRYGARCCCPFFHRLNPWDSPTGCRNNAVFLTRPHNLAMTDAVMFEVEAGSASFPTSRLGISGDFVPPVCVLGRQGWDSPSLVGREAGCKVIQASALSPLCCWEGGKPTVLGGLYGRERTGLNLLS